METMRSDGATLALFGAMAGALIAQLKEFQPAMFADIGTTVGFCVALTVLCVSAISSARAVASKSPWQSLALIMVVISVAFILAPLWARAFADGFNALSPDDRRGITIKSTVVLFVVAWAIYHGVDLTIERQNER